MRALVHWVANPRKRSYWRSVVAGLLCHYITVVLLLTLLQLVRPLVWATLYGVPYQSPPGAVDPNSNEGTLLQVLALLSWIPAGAASVHWSISRSASGVFTLLAYVLASLMLSVALDLQPAMPLLRAIWYWICTPIGIAIGAAAYVLRADKNAIASAA